MLNKMLPSLKSGDEPAKPSHSEGDDEFLNISSADKIDMDSIRARGFAFTAFFVHYKIDVRSELQVTK